MTIKNLAKAAWTEIKTTLDCLAAVYFDRVRWREFTIAVTGAATLAAKAMIYIHAPHYTFAASLIVGAWTALMYLRIPKKPEKI